MNWPLSQDYNEAVQNPATSFSDPDLKKGEVVLNALGLPVPRSGNFADVYEFKGGDGKKWALKCFTRKVAGLQERYAKIDEHLTKAQFPFTVGFKYMTEGIKVRGQWFPLLKMEWVEGFTLNEFIRDNADKKQYLHALMQMWGKLTALLRDGNFAHADLQHGNVLLVPATTGGKLGLRLIDYDGMWVPALAETHSGEVGHPNFQHPLRLKDRLYNADVDRFPHLVIAAALRATLLGGKELWNKFDNGDNLLFKEGDLRDPANAPVFKALWNLHDDVLCTLVGKMALATQEPLRRTPWLDDLLLTDEGKRLNDAEEAKVIELLGVAPHFTAAKTAVAPAAVQDEFNAFAFEEEPQTKGPISGKSPAAKLKSASDKTPGKKKGAKQEKAKSKLPLYIGGGVAAVALIVGIILATSGGNKTKPSEQQVVKNDEKKQEPPPKVIVPPPKKDNTGEVKVDDSLKKKDDSPPKKSDDPPPKKDPELVAKKDPAGGMVEEPRLAWKTQGNTYPNCLAFTEDGAQILRTYYSPPHRVHIHGVGDGVELAPMKPPNLAAHMLSVRTGPENVLVFTMNTSRVVIQDYQTQKIRANFAIPKGIYAIPIARERQVCFVPDAPEEIGVYSLRDGSRIEALKLPRADTIRHMDCSPDGKVIVAFTTDGELYAKKSGDPGFQSIFKASAPSNRKVNLSPDFAHVAIIDRGEIHVLETATGKEHRVLRGHTEEIRDDLFSPNGRYLLSISKDKTVRIWDVESGKQHYSIDLESSPKAMALSPDGRTVAIATEDNSLLAYKLTYSGGTAVAKQDPIVPPVGAPALLKAPFTKEQAEKARGDWAKFLNIPEKKELDLGKGVKLELALIPPGEFMMGDQKKRPVTILKPFYIAATETTQEQYTALTGNNPSGFAPTGQNKNEVVGMGTTKFPVDKVSWRLASEFCETIKGQLPTEAQWEYTCRAGTTTDFHFGDTMTQANCNGGKTLNRTTAVKSYAPNAFGLYDMHGNVHEHTRRLEPNAENSSQKDPDAPPPPADIGRMIRRGGAWNDLDCKSSRRSETAQNTTLNYEGFRVTMPAPENHAAIAKLPDPDPKEIAKKDLSNDDFVYCSDMQGLNIKNGPWPVTLNGRLGNKGAAFAPDNREITVKNEKTPKGIAMHPVTNSHASIQFKLSGKGEVFRSRVALDDTANNVPDEGFFVVLGDGKELWKSASVRQKGEVQTCEVSVRGVEILELRTLAPNLQNGLHMVWLDPGVSSAKAKVAKKDPEPAPMPKSPDELAEVWKGSAASHLNSLSFSKDGARLAISSRTLDVSLLDVRNGSLVGRQKVSDSAISASTFAANNLVFAVDSDRRLIAWDLTGKAKLAEYNVVCAPMQFPIAADIIHLPQSKAVGLYSLKDNKSVGSLPLTAKGEITWMSVTPDGRSIVLCTSAGEIFAKTNDADSFKLLTTLLGGGQRRVAVAPDGKSFAFSFNKEPIRILDMMDGKDIKFLEGHTDEVLAIQFLPDGNRLVSLARDNTLRLWNVEEGKPLFEAKLGVGSALAMAVSPDGKSIAVGGTGGTQLWRFGGDAAVVKKDPEMEPKVAPPVGKAPELLKAPFTKEDADKSRAAWAKYLRLPEKRPLNVGNNVVIDLILIPPGEFPMGDKKSKPVTISKPFYMAVTETTQEQYAAVIGKNPSKYSATGQHKDAVTGLDTSKFPAEAISPKEGAQYCERLKVQLPTDAQWEYACRAGTTTAYYFGDTLSPEDANAGKTPRPVKVASYKPNAFGLYDMHGNAAEHCMDYFGNLSDLTNVDPAQTVAQANGGFVFRGGAWLGDAAGCRSWVRNSAKLNDHWDHFGFRVVVPIVVKP